MSKTKLEEIMEEVIPVLDGITDELVSFELTKEQYEWFLVEAVTKEELEARVKALEGRLKVSEANNDILKHEIKESERVYTSSIQMNRLLRSENQRFKQALEEIRNARYEYFLDEYADAVEKIVSQALQGGNDNE